MTTVTFDTYQYLPTQPLATMWPDDGNASDFTSHNNMTSPDEKQGYHLINENVESASQRFALIMRQYVVPTICICGMIGNVMNIVILTRRRVRRAIETQERVVYLGLVSLAMSDLMFCIAAFPRAFVDEAEVVFRENDPRLYYQMYCTGFVTTFSLISTWLVVFMAGIRYIAICNPLHSRSIIDTKRTYLVMGSVCVLCVLGNIPTFWMFIMVEYTFEYPKLMLMDLGTFSHLTNHGLAFQWIKTILGTFIPCTLLIYFNYKLMQALRESERIRKEHGNDVRNSSRNRLTITLIAIVVMFILLVYPCELMDFCTHLIHVKAGNPELQIAVRAVANALQIINFSFNFVLYCVINRQFRSTVKDIFMCTSRLRSLSRRLPSAKYTRSSVILDQTIDQTDVDMALSRLPNGSRRSSKIPKINTLHEIDEISAEHSTVNSKG